MMDPKAFISEYSADQVSHIAFASNGEVGSKLVDRNAENRRAIAKLVIQSPSLASDLLIRDLYDAETNYSKASFSVYHQLVLVLAQELLARGGEANWSCYLRCVMRAQDSYMSSQCVALEKPAAEAAVAYIDRMLAELGEAAPDYYGRVRGNLARQIVG
jgi:hypothetical protein